jgi:hypothetical protein
MQTMRESWADERLDDLNGRVGDGFRQVDARFQRVEGEIRGLRGEMNDRFDRVDDRFKGIDDRLDRVGDRIDAMQRTMLQGVIGLCGVFVTGFVALGGLIVTQL